MLVAMENLSQCHFVHHESNAGWRVHEFVIVGRSNYITHLISFVFTYVVYEHLFFYLLVLCQNVVSCRFLTNASMEFICIS